MITLCKEDFDRQGYYCCFQCKKYRPDDPIMKCKVPGMIACDSPYNGECLSCLHFESIALMKKKRSTMRGFPIKTLRRSDAAKHQKFLDQRRSRWASDTDCHWTEKSTRRIQDPDLHEGKQRNR